MCACLMCDPEKLRLLILPVASEMPPDPPHCQAKPRGGAVWHRVGGERLERAHGARGTPDMELAQGRGEWSFGASSMAWVLCASAEYRVGTGFGSGGARGRNGAGVCSGVVAPACPGSCPWLSSPGPLLVGRSAGHAWCLGLYTIVQRATGGDGPDVHAQATGHLRDDLSRGERLVGSNNR